MAKATNCETQDCEGDAVSRGKCTRCYNRWYVAQKVGDTYIPQARKKSYARRGPWLHKLTDINVEDMTATCATCGHIDIVVNSTSSTQCAEGLRQANTKARKKVRDIRIDQLSDECESCKIPASKATMCWDHVHATGLFRGTLCRKCNSAFGLLLEDPRVITGLLTYLYIKAPEKVYEVIVALQACLHSAIDYKNWQ